MSQRPNQRMGSRPIQIQPSQANQLVQALKNEVELAKAAGSDTAKAQAHYAKAESIKQILINYQAQQKAKQAQLQGQNQASTAQPQVSAQSQSIQSSSQMNLGTPSGSSPMMGSPMTGQSSNSYSQGSGGAPNSSATSNLGRQQSPGAVSGVGAGTPTLPANAITVENFNQVKARLGEFERRIQQLTTEKKNYNLTPDQINQIESQLTELKGKYTKYQKFAFYMKNQLLEQARNKNQPQQQSQQQQPQQSQQQFNQSNNVPTSQMNQSGPTMSGATVTAGPTTTTTANAPTPAPGAAGVAATNASITTNSEPPVPSTQTQPPVDKSPTKMNSQVNLTGITKQAVPSFPISSSINVKPPNPVPMRPNGNNIRPTLSGGVANGLGQSLGTPALYKLPSYELTNTGNTLPDSGGRVLSKRKLSELVNTIGSDEGDGKTTIDGDVEELLLDLADEFITSVTGFACRLAKHRKVETIDVKDVQLHLEKNWNIKIPGYSIDEIKSVRKYQPSTSYQQKVSGVDIAKSVNDIN